MTKGEEGVGYVELRKSLYNQAQSFVHSANPDWQRLILLENITDPMSNETEAMEQTHDPADYLQGSNSVDRIVDSRLGYTERWSSLTGGMWVLICDTFGNDGWFHAFPGAMIMDAGIMLWIAIPIFCFFFLAPLQALELTISQIYQGNAPRVFPMLNVRYAGFTVLVIFICVAEMPRLVLSMGIAARYLIYSLEVPLPWTLTAQNYSECKSYIDPLVCEASDRCAMLKEFCVASPFKLAEYFFNNKIVTHVRDNTAANWTFAVREGLLASCMITCIFVALAANLGGRKLLELFSFLAIGVNVLLMLCMLPLVLIARGAVEGLKTSLGLWGWFHFTLWEPRSFMSALSVVLQSSSALTGVYLYIGAGFKVSNKKTRNVPYIAAAFTTIFCWLQCLLWVALSESGPQVYFDSIAAANYPPEYLQENYIGLSDLGKPQFSRSIKSLLSPLASENVAYIVQPESFSRFYGASGWALLYFTSHLLRTFVRLVLRIKTINVWLDELRYKSVWWSVGVSVTFLASSAGFCLVGRDDAYFVANSLASMVYQYMRPLGVASLLYFLTLAGTRKWQFSSYIGLAFPLFFGVLAAVFAVFAPRLKEPKQIPVPEPNWVKGLQSFNWIATILVCVAFSVPSAYAFFDARNSVVAHHKLKESFRRIFNYGGIERFRKRSNLIIGVKPSIMRLHAITFTIPLQYILPWTFLGCCFIPFFHNRLQPNRDAFRENYRMEYFFLGPALAPIQYPAPWYYALAGLTLTVIPLAASFWKPMRMGWLWPDTSKLWAEQELVASAKPGARIATGRKRFSFFEEVLSDPARLWRNAFKTKERARY